MAMAVEARSLRLHDPLIYVREDGGNAEGLKALENPTAGPFVSPE